MKHLFPSKRLGYCLTTFRVSRRQRTLPERCRRMADVQRIWKAFCGWGAIFVFSSEWREIRICTENILVLLPGVCHRPADFARDDEVMVKRRATRVTENVRRRMWLMSPHDFFDTSGVTASYFRNGQLSFHFTEEFCHFFFSPLTDLLPGSHSASMRAAWNL